MHELLWQVPLGFVLGAIGTLIGAGGGFLLMPVLIFIYPDDSPTLLTSISLAVVALNAISGSVAYAHMGRIDYKIGSLFAAAGVPGVILGTIAVERVSVETFNAILGVVLVGGALTLIQRTLSGKMGNGDAGHAAPQLSRGEAILGAALSAGVGFLSSLLGIGGGIIHVPALISMLDYPAHAATATSHFVLAFMATLATVIHVATGALDGGYSRAMALGIGVVVGAQVGARLSTKVRSHAIVLALSGCLLLVGGRVIWQAFK